MAPEYPPQLVIFDARFEGNKLTGDLHYIEVPVGQRLRVRWDAEDQPENFRPVGGGVACVYQTDDLQVLPVSRDSIPDDLGNLRYRWSEGLNHGVPWLMFVLILPGGYTLAEASPRPARAKVFADRLAVYWILKGDDLGRTQVAGTLRAFEGSARAQLVELNRLCSGENPPPNRSIEIEGAAASAPPLVFISYSHDSAEHRDQVLALSERLRADGIETSLDQYLNGSPPEGWPRWMLNQLDAADFVLVVCTENYYRRFRGHAEPGKGKGVDWEGALITQELYDSRGRTLKFVPVFLSAPVEKWIPEPLRSHSFYTLTSKSAYDSLYDLLLAQAGVEPGKVGDIKVKPRRKGAPLTFEDPEPDRSPQRPPPIPPGPAVSLMQVLAGRWQVQIQPAFAQAVMGQMNLDLFPNGLFRGQLINPMGVTGVEGQWQANPIQNQIALQGMQSNGFQVIPYAVMVQINSFDPQHLLGVTSGGEQVRWRRVNPPNAPPPMSPF